MVAVLPYPNRCFLWFQGSQLSMLESLLMAGNVHYVFLDWEEKSITALFVLTQKAENKNYSSSRHTDSEQKTQGKIVPTRPSISYDQ